MNIKKKRMVLISVLAIVIIFVITGVTVFKSMIKKAEAGLEQLNEMVLYDIDLKKIPDGEYEGSYEVFPVQVEVRVRVSNHTITDIKLLKHRNGKGKDAEVIPNRIIKAQSIMVDSVSGATYSSKVIQKAVEVALLSSLK